jgi:folate-binding protein YgfZ
MERSDSSQKDMLTITEAYRAAHESGVWVQRAAGPRLIRLTGPQRVWFLQNTITADVEDVPSGRSVESCFLDPKGRVVAHFRVGFLDDHIWIDADPASGAQLREWFVKYRFRTKVDIEPVARPLTTVLGPPAGEIAGAAAIALLEDGAVAFGRTLGGVAAADVHGANPGSSLPQGPPELYDVLRIEEGAGEFGTDFGPSDLPQEAGLTRVVSVEKGCYVGQETIARIHFRGHVNRVLRTLEFTGSLPGPGTKLFWNGGSAGSVTSAVVSPGRGPIGLGMVRVEPPAGAALDVESGGTATVGPVPEGTKIKIP